MTGKTLDWKKMCKLTFGAYAQVHEDRNITNTFMEWTRKAICLGPTGNVQVTYNFISLRTGKNIIHGQLTDVPTPTIVMKRVVDMALEEKPSEGIISENCAGIAVDNKLTDADVSKLGEISQEWNRIRNA